MIRMMTNARDPYEPGTILKERARFFNAEFDLYHGGPSPRMQLKMWMFGRSLTHSWKFESVDGLRAQLSFQLEQHVLELLFKVVQQIQICIDHKISIGRVYQILETLNIMVLPLH
jgi:hypothetical protein